MKDTQSDFINKAIKKHGDKYDYSNVVYEKSNKHVIIICKIHGEFIQTPNKHLLYNGCKKCSMSKIIEKTKLTTEIFINKSKFVHNNVYDYSKTEYGKNNMGSYASQLSRLQRWQIIQYVRTLQPKAESAKGAATAATKADSAAVVKIIKKHSL
jgi:3-methyladenine DNA glycosylase AlkC